MKSGRKLGLAVVGVRAVLRLDGQHALAGEGDELEPALGVGVGLEHVALGVLHLAELGHRVQGRAVDGDVVGDPRLHRLAGRLIDDAAFDRDAAIQRDVEGDRPEAGRVVELDHRLEIRRAGGRDDHHLVARAPRHADEPVVALGVALGLDDRVVAEILVGQLVAADGRPGDRRAGLAVADDPLDRPARRGGQPERGAVERPRAEPRTHARQILHPDRLAGPGDDLDCRAGGSSAPRS